MALDDRLLRVLRALNELGLPSVLDLHRATGLSRPAVHRIVETLCEHGYAERVGRGNRIRLTSLVRTLSAGYRDDDLLTEHATPILARLQRVVQWPSSLATPAGGRMVVRETTRHRSPFVFDNGAVGLHLPILSTALGLGWIAFCGEEARRITLDLLRQSPDPWDRVARDAEETASRLGQTAARGYGYREGGYFARTSSISLPIMAPQGAVGALCVTFVTSVVPFSRATADLLPPLRAAAAEIARCGFRLATPVGRSPVPPFGRPPPPLDGRSAGNAG